MYDQAVASYFKVAELEFSPDEIEKIKAAYAKSGWKGYLQGALNVFLEKSKKDYASPFVMASFYARLGQKDEAFAQLEKGLQERDFRLSHVKSFEFDSLRSDPRFADLLKRIGLPP
jgi:hypothetical protein